ncbi:hypothetical protein MtrunA17_Chr5g0417021 [Medicago truncatula]|uniref:Uncharacterized protein n=1 Tax=Medicago truncatula TaxID=3880 RepID=A0A396HXC9_MEDTR|nr:hypothetical protein MtrunA17_Chr5g0417021 [Medicago truncatula]
MEKGNSLMPVSLKPRYVVFSILPKISGKLFRLAQFLKDMVLREGKLMP